jgi:DNA-binding NtrC family response regulator
MRKLRVIIFDDEAIVLHVLKRWLSKKGYEVITFDEPTVCPILEKKTKDCMKENQCADIIITDFKMPRMNGMELLQHQSQRGCWIDIRNKAIITAYMDNEVKNAIEKLGCSFFEKPFQLSEISDWINDCEKRIDLSLPLGSL